MPNIKTYDTPALDIRPTEVGIHATEAVGRRAGQFFNQMGQALGGGVRDVGDAYVAYHDHQQISRGIKDGSDEFVSLENEWNDIAKNSDPNDPTVAAKFREERLEPALEKFQNGFTTQNSQKFGQQFAERVRNHMVNKTAADMSTLAGVAVKSNATRTINNLASAANRDPSSLDFALETLDASLEALIGSSPNLTPAGAARVKEETGLKAKRDIIHSAVSGMLKKNPNVNLDDIQKKYGEYITGAEMQQFQQAAKAYAKSDLLTQHQIEQYKKQQAADQSHTALSKIWTDSVKFDADGKSTIKPDYFKRVMDTEESFPGAATERARSMINWGQAQQRERREVIVTDKAVQADLLDGMFRTENPTTDVDVLKAEVAGKLDSHASSTLLRLHKALEDTPLKGPIYQGVMTAVKGSLGDSEKGHENYAKFLQMFIPEYISQSRSGTLPPDALDLRNPESLISKSLNPWKLTQAERLQALIQKNSRGIIGGDLNGDPFAPPPVNKPAVALPTLDKREAGKVYDTARGKMKWTGTGWVAP